MSAKAVTPLRVGAVPFLNGRPLVRFLDPSSPPPTRLTLEVPSLLTEMMKNQKLDVALLPTIEYFRARTYRIIPGISISADGEVQSVRIYSKVPIGDIRSVALDNSSRTSVALARIILKRKLATMPLITGCSPQASLDDLDVDAMLLIGDPAMKFRSKMPVHILDLGQAWKELTCLPFVYAMWVVRDRVEVRELAAKLSNARERGLASLEDISREASSETGLAPDVCLLYLRDVMHYGLGSREIEALTTFRNLAAEDNLCPGDVEIAFDHG
ncbi:MAG: menaquinone biosynthesis protein [Candidatus Abyssubacteria bacterium]